MGESTALCEPILSPVSNSHVPALVAKSSYNIISMLDEEPIVPMFKIIILGNSGVGKTSLMLRFATRVFEKSFRPTLGADFMKKIVKVDDKDYNLQLWDTAGQERFRGLCTSLFHGADACILVFDITNEQSFHDLRHWKDSFLATVNPDFSNFLVIGNKVDQAHSRTVSKRRASLWCSEEDAIGYYESSAMDGSNIDEAFFRLVKHMASQKPFMSTNSIRLDQDPTLDPNAKEEGCVISCDG